MRSALVILIVATLFASLVSPALARDPAVEEAKKKLSKNAADPFEQQGRASAIRALGNIGGKAAAAALLEIFDDEFVHLRDHAVSAWIRMLDGARADETLAWLAKKALKHKNAAVRLGAATAIGVARKSEARDAVLARIAKERDESVAQALLRAWPVVGGKAEPAVTKLLAHTSGVVALAAAESLVRAEVAEQVSADQRAQLLRHRSPLGRAGGVLLQQAAGGLTTEQVGAVLKDKADAPKIALGESLEADVENTPWETVAAPVLGKLLADASWRVRAAAVRTARTLWMPEVVPLLIERLAQENGRLKLDIGEVLAAMTGKDDLGWDAELWKAYWDVKGDGKLAAKSKTNRGRRKAPRALPRGEGKTAAFFRLPVVSKRLAFLLDCSGSMGKPALGKEVGGVTKWNVARRELAKTLSDLDEETAFDVFVYRYPSTFPPKPFLTRVFKRLSPCSKKRARTAVEWLARQEAKGWDAAYDSLKRLIDTEEVDTIFFLSDGRPSRGRYERGNRLIPELTKDNRFRRVAIHTVLVGKSGADRTFMQRLAEATGGRFVDAIPDLKEALAGNPDK